MLSARAIALEVSSRRIDAAQALAEANQNYQQREAALQVYTTPAPSLAAGTGPLAGIGVGVKDIFDTFDMKTEYGSPIHAGHQPTSDASLVTMLRNAGATITGKTVTTEFAWFSPGATRNPHNQDHTPGGSSSGSAAGVAAGYFAAAIGSQTGGSIIRPAAFCGVSGYKPGFRLFPTVGMKQFSWSLDTPGFFAASPADVAFVAAACSGRALEVDVNDNTPPRFGLYLSSVDHLMDEEMASALVIAAELAQAAGASVTSVKGPEAVEDGRKAHTVIQHYEAGLALADEFARSADQLSPDLRTYLNSAATISADRYDDARRTANKARKASHLLFGDCDILLAPSAPGTAPEGLESTGDPAFNALWTLLGFPVVNVPGLHGKNGLPLGLQIIAPFGKDRRALQAAHWLETLLHDQATAASQ